MNRSSEAAIKNAHFKPVGTTLCFIEAQRIPPPRPVLFACKGYHILYIEPTHYKFSHNFLFVNIICARFEVGGA